MLLPRKSIKRQVQCDTGNVQCDLEFSTPAGISMHFFGHLDRSSVGGSHATAEGAAKALRRGTRS